MAAKTILLVEDVRVIGLVVSGAIQRRVGGRVVVAQSLAATRAVLESDEPVALAVVDYTLPDAPHGEAVEEVLGRGIPTIVMTATFDDALRERMLQRDIVDYVIKREARDLERLVALVERVLANSKESALVVDDSAVYREAMAATLRSQMLQVHQASDGMEAVRILEAHPEIRLIITDHHMRQMSGLELLTHVRREHSYDKRAVVVASAADANLIPRFLKAGANDFLRKPFSVEELICRVNMNLEMLRTVERLETMANRDALTGLYNRRYFFEVGARLHAATLRSGGRPVVLMLDIDHFKRVNDTHGHDAGDAVIRHVAGLISARFRRSSDIVARFGGEEFCVLGAHENVSQIASFAEELRNDVQSSIVPYQGEELRATVSIGVCVEPLGELQGQLKRADELLYRAKALGRNRCCLALE